MNEPKRTELHQEISDILKHIGAPEFPRILEQWSIRKYGTKENNGKICCRCYSTHQPASWRKWFDNKHTRRHWEAFICEECYADLYTEESLLGSVGKF